MEILRLKKNDCADDEFNKKEQTTCVAIENLKNNLTNIFNFWNFPFFHIISWKKGAGRREAHNDSHRFLEKSTESVPTLKFAKKGPCRTLLPTAQEYDRPLAR